MATPMSQKSQHAQRRSEAGRVHPSGLRGLDLQAHAVLGERACRRGPEKEHSQTWMEANICSYVPSNIRPQPMANRASPTNALPKVGK